VQTFELKISGVTFLQGVEFRIFLFILAWALQRCSSNTLPVIYTVWNSQFSCHCLLNLISIPLVVGCFLISHFMAWKCSHFFSEWFRWV